MEWILIILLLVAIEKHCLSDKYKKYKGHGAACHCPNCMRNAGNGTANKNGAPPQAGVPVPIYDQYATMQQTQGMDAQPIFPGEPSPMKRLWR